jgi:hypothetical protein
VGVEILSHRHAGGVDGEEAEIEEAMARELEDVVGPAIGEGLAAGISVNGDGDHHRCRT